MRFLSFDLSFHLSYSSFSKSLHSHHFCHLFQYVSHAISFLISSLLMSLSIFVLSLIEHDLSFHSCIFFSIISFSFYLSSSPSLSPSSKPFIPSLSSLKVFLCIILLIFISILYILIFSSNISHSRLLLLHALNLSNDMISMSPNCGGPRLMHFD